MEEILQMMIIFLIYWVNLKTELVVRKEACIHSKTNRWVQYIMMKWNMKKEKMTKMKMKMIAMKTLEDMFLLL